MPGRHRAKKKRSYFIRGLPAVVALPTAMVLSDVATATAQQTPPRTAITTRTAEHVVSPRLASAPVVAPAPIAGLIVAGSEHEVAQPIAKAPRSADPIENATAIGSAAGQIVGGATAAALGSAIGTALVPAAPPAGLVAGGILGAAAGTYVGYYAGSYLGSAIGQQYPRIVPNVLS